jgi:transcriptional regulator with XRE-family HTH domain
MFYTSRILGGFLNYSHPVQTTHKGHFMNDTFVSQRLETYLDSTRLSMNQIAGKWGVSAALLSQVKNGKKRASLELGLKILRESGATLEERKRWVEERHAGGLELGRIYKDERRKTVEFALKKSLGDLFENAPVLMDLFLDISLMKERGLSWNGVFKNYGEYGLELAQTLIESGLVEKRGERFYIVQDQLTHTIDTENSLGIMKSVFELLKQKYKRDGFRGEFHFDINDISPEGYYKLKELNIEYTRKMVKVIEEHEMPRVKGGLRIVAQNLVSILRCFAWIVFLSCSLITISESSLAQGSGLRGGGSGKLIDGTGLSIHQLKRVLNTSEPGLFPQVKTPYDIRINNLRKRVVLEYQNATLETPHFSTEEEALQSVIQINQKLIEGRLGQDEIGHLVRNWPHRCGIGQGNLDATTRQAITKAYRQKGVIKPQGLKVYKSFSPSGQERYSAIVGFYLPCPEKAD